MREALAVIPARYGSTRFPGKPLADICGKPMIRRVVEGVRASRRLARVIVATDDRRIYDAVRGFGADAAMTSPDHVSGTDRVAEVAAAYDYPIVINVQGDEPLIDGETIDGLVDALQDPGLPMASLMARIEDMSAFDSPDRVKVVVDGSGNALYFSRSAIPHGGTDFYFLHIGIYGYQRDFLLNLKSLKPSRLEETERLEQLRALENGHRIRMIEIPRPTVSIDVPEDAAEVERVLRTRGLA